ncbi:MAG: hypothetical protein J1D88_06350 [Treponema sp.]|nr:hypothetical protein [Treponema sp.]
MVSVTDGGSPNTGVLHAAHMPRFLDALTDYRPAQEIAAAAGGVAVHPADIIRLAVIEA